MKLSQWESFLAKLEAYYSYNIDGELSTDELDIAWEVCEAGGTLEQAVDRINDYAAQQVVKYFEEQS